MLCYIMGGESLFQVVRAGSFPIHFSKIKNNIPVITCINIKATCKHVCLHSLKTQMTHLIVEPNSSNGWLGNVDNLSLTKLLMQCQCL